MSLKGREIMHQRRQAERNSRILERRETQREIKPKRVVVLGGPNAILTAALLSMLEAESQEGSEQ